MSDFVIVTDSTADLPPTSVREQDIRIVPLKVVFGDEILTDGVDCDGASLFKKVEQTGSLPKTSAPSPGDFAACFGPIIETGRSLLYIGISTELSSTVQNAVIAAQEYPEGSIEIVDSRNLSTGIGLLVLKAADLRREGKSLQETAETIRELTAQVKTGFVIDTLDYLYKGGRLSSLSHLVGSMLKIKPLVRVTDGKMGVADKLRGSGRKVAEVMLEQALADKERIDPARVFVTHAAADEIAAHLKEQLEQQLGGTEVLLSRAGSVISSHCGPGTVGILYIVTNS